MFSRRKTSENSNRQKRLAFIIIAITIVLLFSSCRPLVVLGTTYSGTIKANDTADGEWRAHVYPLFVSAGTTYIFELSSSSGDTIAIWNSDRGGFIIEVSPVVTSRTAVYTFSTGGYQEFWVETPVSDTPSKYTWSISEY